jgi:hypothetical protein
MRWLVSLLLLMGLVVFAGYIFVKGYPYRLYSNWVKGEEWNRYYRIENYSELYLRPVEGEPLASYKEEYEQLWRSFPLRNSSVPLPTRHPLFNTVPFLELPQGKSGPHLGMIITDSNKRELTRIFTRPTSLLSDYSLGQDLFKLPFVRNRIMKYNIDELWKAIFSRAIEVNSKDMDEMIFDLYILHIRSKILPRETIRYGLIDKDKALIELKSSNKDYRVEMILAQQNGALFSYVLRTEINNPESVKLRSKFLSSISFSNIDPALGRVLYTEFKQLNFSRQIDQEGMLYLFSAWTQEIEKPELLKEMIFYLERGRNLKTMEQLKKLYAYAFRKYGKTFTTRNIFSESDDPELILQRKIEIENIEKRLEADRTKAKLPEAPELTPDERMNMYLKKVKETKPQDKNEMTIH